MNWLTADSIARESESSLMLSRVIAESSGGPKKKNLYKQTNKQINSCVFWGAGCNSLYCCKCFLEWFLPLTLNPDPVQGWGWRGPGSSSCSAQAPWLECWALLGWCGVFCASEPGRVLGHVRLAVVSVASLWEMPACLVVGVRKVWNSFEVGTCLLCNFPAL